MTAEEEFAAFYEAEKDRCLRAAALAKPSDPNIEDAVADAFVQAWTRWHSVRLHPNGAAWVVRTALNQRISLWRRRRREVPWSEPFETQGSNDVASSVDSTHIWEALGSLPERQRQVLALRLVLGLTAAEAADELGIAEGTVWSHSQRAIAALRTALIAEKRPNIGEALHHGN